ncbi:MAG: hypothetical protein KKA60_05585 [Proteobacteria bacterium]|nr:hypothetical protein [Pseudomonadota bacterium]
MTESKARRTVAVLSMLTAMGLAAFWAAFFFFDMRPANPPPCYLPYEMSFPLPDLILAAVLLAAGALYYVGSGTGAVLTLVCSGALIFLGMLDVSFNIQNGVYSSSNQDLIANVFINLWSVGFGLAAGRTAAGSLKPEMGQDLPDDGSL